MTTSDSRDALRQRIEQGEARLAQRDLVKSAEDAAKAAGDFVRAHPIASVAGVATIALVIGAMTRPGRRIGNRAAGFASYATDAGIAYALGLLDAAGDVAGNVRDAGTERFENLGDRFDRTSRKAKREGTYLAATARDAMHDLGRRAGRKAGRAMRSTRSSLTN